MAKVCWPEVMQMQRPPWKGIEIPRHTLKVKQKMTTDVNNTPKPCTLLVGLAEEVLLLVVEAAELVLVVPEPVDSAEVVVADEDRSPVTVIGVSVPIDDAVLVLETAGGADSCARRQVSLASGFAAPVTWEL